MVLVILGVNDKVSKFSLSYYSLTVQIVIINFFNAIIALFFLVFFNYFLLINNKNIINKIDEIDNQIQDIKKNLQNNAIIRKPQFNEDSLGGDIVMSEPQLDPYSTQNYLISKYLKQSNNIKIYDLNLVKFADTGDLYTPEDIIILDISSEPNRVNFFKIYKKNYLFLFNKVQKFFDKKKLLQKSQKYQEDIDLIKEVIKIQKSLVNIFNIDKNNFILTHLSPIIKNDDIYGVVLVNGNLVQENNESGLVSFNLFNLVIIIIFFMFLLSFFFSKSIIKPIKILSVITKSEQNKFKASLNNPEYPIRNDEIGILSQEIENMSKDLKLRIVQLENFTADVSHELKNPLASLKSSNELLIDNKIQKNKKMVLLRNMQKDIDQMNILISNISNYARTQVEITEELFEEFDLIKLITEVINSYSGNEKKVQIIFKNNQPSLIVRLNREKLARVFINLINNSFSFAPFNSSIFIKLLINDNKLKIYFVDQGRGINMNLKDKIFERFYSDRPKKNESKLEHHSGLGLSISKNIIESFSGLILLSDYRPINYKGACFKIELPL